MNTVSEKGPVNSQTSFKGKINFPKMDETNLKLNFSGSVFMRLVTQLGYVFNRKTLFEIVQESYHQMTVIANNMKY